MPPVRFCKPENWEDFFFPLQDMPCKEKAVASIWQTYQFPQRSPRISYDLNSSLPQIYFYTTKTQAIIQITDPDALKISLADQDVLAVTGNFAFLMVIIGLFYTEGDVYLIFHTAKWMKIVFGDIQQRAFKDTSGDYSTLKCYLFLLLENRHVHISVDYSLKLDMQNAQEIVLSDNFQAVMFKHNFLNSRGVLSQQSKIMTILFQGKTYTGQRKLPGADGASNKLFEHSSNAYFVSGIVTDERVSRSDQRKSYLPRSANAPNDSTATFYAATLPPAENVPKKTRRVVENAYSDRDVTRSTKKSSSHPSRHHPERRQMKPSNEDEGYDQLSTSARSHKLSEGAHLQAEYKVPPEKRLQSEMEPRAQQSELQAPAALAADPNRQQPGDLTVLQIQGTREQIMNLISYLPLELISTLVLK